MMRFASLSSAYLKPAVRLQLAPTKRFLSFSQTRRALADKESFDLPVIPDPPPIPEILPELNALGEPTLASLGLCGWYPSGLYQSFLETIHVSLDVPWWGAIIGSTLLFRAILFPFVVTQRANMAHYTAFMPQILELQSKFTDARVAGNVQEMMKYGDELNRVTKESNFSPLTMFKPMLVQIPLFLSVFSGLRGIANLPVESFKTGGAFWFENLTVPDPYYILPIISMVSLLGVMEISMMQQQQGASSKSKNVQMFMRLMPIVGIFFTMRMPSALLLYWSASNVISLGQTGLLKIPAVKKFFKIPDIKPPKITSIKKEESKGFMEGLRSSMDNSRLMAELDVKKKNQFDQFKKAGMAKPIKTKPLKKENGASDKGTSSIIDEDIDKISSRLR